MCCGAVMVFEMVMMMIRWVFVGSSCGKNEFLLVPTWKLLCIQTRLPQISTVSESAAVEMVLFVCCIPSLLFVIIG